MQTERELVAQQSVIELHQWIENVFSNHLQQELETLNKLLNSFASDFTMITTSGQCMTLDQVKTMFSLNIGSRPGLKIEIDECEVITSNEESVVLRYREKHTRDGSTHSRWSVVSISYIDGHPRWRYLHETAIAE
ncbi:hypothetical protein ID858_11870 [Xenorhabdus sp. DI]|uniref:hypothetical protein n=1 Tax=Xenorhabdus doucetiae TaxID=351671 RepID=UPI00198F7559|nr:MULTISPECIES: hypothetical protein [unclassified Xenorhabdus]MBD2784945.1 hypothetical protein [Xenorhabdus sp. 3]MBD2789206.1 hypothetical protein [Xenorhabdus sp. DI]